MINLYEITFLTKPTIRALCVSDLSSKQCGGWGALLSSALHLRFILLLSIHMCLILYRVSIFHLRPFSLYCQPVAPVIQVIQRFCMKLLIP